MGDKPPAHSAGKTNLIALRKDYYAMYLPKEEGGNGAHVLHIRDKDGTLAFYRTLNEKKMTTDPLGQE